MLELFECLPHTDDSDAATGGIKDGVRQLPAELLGGFEAHRLLAFDAIGFFQGRQIEPAFGCFSFHHALRTIADESIDERYMRSKDPGFDEIGNRDIARHEDVGFNTSSGGVCSRCSSRISCSGYGDLLDTKFAAHRNRARDTAGLEGERGIHAFILEPEIIAFEAFAEMMEPMQRREAFLQRHDVLFGTNRQHRCVSPHRPRRISKRVAVPLATHFFEVIPHQQRPPCSAQIMNFSSFEPFAGSAAFQMTHIHIDNPNRTGSGMSSMPNRSRTRVRISRAR